MPNPVQLLLANHPTWRCPQSNKPAVFIDAELQVHFEEKTALLQMELGYCDDSQIYLADLMLVEEVLDAVDLALTEVRDFSLDGTPVEAAVWMGENYGAIPWDVFVEGLKGSPQLGHLPPPTPQEVLSLPQTRETWMVAQTPSGYHLDDQGTPTLNFVGVVVSPDGLVRSVLLREQPLGPEEVAELLARGCLHAPNDLSVERPQGVLVNDPALAEGLSPVLATFGINVEVGDVSLAVEALGALKGALDMDPSSAYYANYAEGEVKAFFKAAKDFYRARPWEVMDGSKFLAFKLEGEPWHYANVMGQAGEEYGLAMFEDWLEVCRTTNNPETPWDLMQAMSHSTPPLPKSLLASGNAESMTLSPLHDLAPEDADYLRRLKARPSWRKEYAVVKRYTPAGMAAPRFALSFYTNLMRVLTERANKVQGNRVTSLKVGLDTPHGKLMVRYPSKGDEDADRSSYYRFQVPFRHGALSKTPGKVLPAVVETPGEVKWHRVMAELTKLAKTQEHVFPWVSQLKQGEYCVWLDQAPIKEPSPTVAQLATLEGLTLQLSMDEEAPLVLEAIPRPEGASINTWFKEG